jgi:hypothetical protein
MNARQWPEGFTPVYRIPEPPMPECSLTERELFRVLRSRVGKELGFSLEHMEAIYDATGEAHFEAAYELRKAAEDICAEWGIEG